VLHGFPRGFHQQPMLRIHRRRFFFRDTEEIRVEVADAVQEAPHLQFDRPGTPGSGS